MAGFWASTCTEMEGQALMSAVVAVGVGISVKNGQVRKSVLVNRGCGFERSVRLSK